MKSFLYSQTNEMRILNEYPFVRGFLWECECACALFRGFSLKIVFIVSSSDEWKQ